MTFLRKKCINRPCLLLSSTLLGEMAACKIFQIGIHQKLHICMICILHLQHDHGLRAHDRPQTHAVVRLKTLTKTAEEAQSVLDTTELWL